MSGKDDCISRQMAIDALDEQIEQCNKALGSFDISPKDEYAIKVERASLEAYKEQLENMPSVQPATNCSEIPNSSDDTISRQVAIEAIGKTSDELYENIKKGATFPQRQWFDGMAQAQSILENLPSAQPEQRWIPCSERLPKTYGAYLVQDVCGTIFVDYWRGYWLAKTTMVAWMPLPEPYRGGERA